LREALLREVEVEVGFQLLGLMDQSFQPQPYRLQLELLEPRLRLDRLYLLPAGQQEQQQLHQQLLL
jgi:hypothetical protein